MATIGTLERVTAATLSKMILAEQSAAVADPTIAVIDVRDDGEAPNPSQIAHLDAPSVNPSPADCTLSRLHWRSH
jgi:hypothetical protein